MSVTGNDGRLEQLASLQAHVAQCRSCDELACTRQRTVFGVGNTFAEVMIVGEAPGADEDVCGEPFVGRAGQLLNQILGACGIAREDVYIANILKCRPPGNRRPTPAESTRCIGYLHAQIAAVRPRVILALGATAAQNLLATEETIGSLRGRLHNYRGVNLVCTFHPAYLLRSPNKKSMVLDDLKFMLAHLGRSGPTPEISGIVLPS